MILSSKEALIPVAWSTRGPCGEGMAPRGWGEVPFVDARGSVANVWHTRGPRAAA